MELAMGVDEHGVGEVLDAVESLRLESLGNEVLTFRLAAHFADLHSVESVVRRRGRGGSVRPGAERAVLLGGEGTPRVAEFAPAVFGARLGTSPYGGRCYLADALDARHRLPRLWGLVVAGRARVGMVRHVAQQTRHLSRVAAGLVDAEVAGCADGRLSWGRFSTKVAAAVVRADPEAAAAAAREAASRQFARASRSGEHGVKGFYVRAAVGVVAQMDAVVAFYAAALKALGDTDGEDLRRVKACLVMTNPVRAVELLQAFAGHRAAATTATASGDSGTAGSAAGGGDDEFGREEPATGDEPDEPGDEPGEPDEPGDEPGEDFDGAEGPVDGDPGGNGPGEAPTGGAGSPGVCASCGAPSGRPSGGSAGGGVAAFVAWGRFRPGQVAPDPGCGAYRAGAAGRYRLDVSGLLPRVWLYVHLSQESLQRGLDGVARFEGEGPIAPSYVREVLGLMHRFRVTPVVDLANQAPVDGYEIPQRHREAVHLRTPADCFPFGSSLSRGKQIDHTEPYRPPDRGGGGDGGGGGPGQSRLENYSPMVAFHHRLKTHGGWQVRQPFSGIYVWRDPYGHFYLVDHTGTRKITPPAGAPEPAGSAASDADTAWWDHDARCAEEWRYEDGWDSPLGLAS